MIEIAKYIKMHDRVSIINYLHHKKFERVLDVGYSANNWSSNFTTHYCDVIESDQSKIGFTGDINFPYVWSKIEEDVSKNGKFDFCVCSHTLEDIINPEFVQSMINKYCKSGFVAVPSKYQECTRNIPHNGSYRGYIHHRYMFNIENRCLVAYPKLNFIETDKRFDKLANMLNENNSELQLLWNGSLELNTMNSNFLGPDVESVEKYYEILLNVH
jgi:hypothetical protein